MPEAEDEEQSLPFRRGEVGEASGGGEGLKTRPERKKFLDEYLAEEMNHYFAQYCRKNQISDHLLLWTSFKIDYADPYLDELSKDKSRAAMA